MVKKDNALGAWAFLIGVVLAVVLALILAIFMPNAGFPIWAAWVLFIIGLIVGLLNISDREVMPFLTAGLVLVLVSFFGASMFQMIPFVSMLLHGMLLLFVPATVIVALKSVFALAKK
ncbi:MAG: hypothetical protein V1659_02865 [Candidatus Woesearchaeota archaeon]